MTFLIHRIQKSNGHLVHLPAKTPSVTLWAQSALYLEDLFSRELPALSSRYLHHEPPLFSALQKYDLVYSFRFGTSLASVLAGEVYSAELQGNPLRDTRIYYIHTPRKNTKERKRSNSAEGEAIAQFIRQNSDREIGVITPYRSQRTTLRKLLPSGIEINTVHSSQGREWDTVIFSVVDSTDKFFTDSNSNVSNGKNIVNTAVSRAKEQLILVCDADYWISQKNQLIGKLLAIAEPYQQ